MLQLELVESSLSWWVLAGSSVIREFAMAVAVSSSKLRAAVSAAVVAVAAAVAKRAALRLRASASGVLVVLRLRVLLGFWYGRFASGLGGGGPNGLSVACSLL